MAVVGQLNSTWVKRSGVWETEDMKKPEFALSAMRSSALKRPWSMDRVLSDKPVKCSLKRRIHV